MCGVVGIVSHSPVNQALYDALTVMQHRGQDAAGIVTWGEDGLRQRRSNGWIVWTADDLRRPVQVLYVSERVEQNVVALALGQAADRQDMGCLWLLARG